MHSYVALLSGITAAVVIIPSMFQPDAYFELAVERVVCTLIGVIVITIGAWFFTPESDLDKFYQQVCRLPCHAFHLLARVLQQAPNTQIDEEKKATLHIMSQLESSMIAVTAGSREGYKRAHLVQSMLVSTLSILAAVRRIQARRNSLNEQDIEAHSSPSRSPSHIPSGTQLADTERAFIEQLLTAYALSQEDRVQALSQTQQAELLNLAKKIDPFLVEDIQLLLHAHTQLLSNTDDAETLADARTFGQKLRYLAPQRDWRLARQTGLIAAVCTWLSSTMAFASGSIVLELGSLGVAMFSMILGSMPSPQKIAPHLLKGLIVGSSIAIIYRLTIYPYIHEPFILILSLIPFLVIGGLARASKRYMFPALDANMSFLIASQAVWPHLVSDPFHIVSESIALMAAAAVVSSGFIFLPRSDDLKATHAARLIRKELQHLIFSSGSDIHAWEARTSRHIIRLMLHITQSNALHHMAPSYVLATLNFGHSASQLLKALPNLSDESRYLLRQLPQEIRQYQANPVQLASRLLAYDRELALIEHTSPEPTSHEAMSLPPSHQDTISQGQTHVDRIIAEQQNPLIHHLLQDTAQALIIGADFFRQPIET